MNRGKMKKVLALMLTFIFVISATACGGATKFDAEAYVRGVMDANYKQKYDEYAKARGISEKDAKAEIEDTLDEQVDTELSGLEALGDFTEEEKQEYLRIIQSSNEFLLQLIGDILDISKIESGKLEFIYTSFRLNEIFQPQERAFSFRAEPGVRIIFETDGNDYYIESEKTRLTQVLTNFLSNAVKFTSSGSIRFGYRLTETGIYVYVTDTGSGIAKKHLSTVFDRFVKLDMFKQGTGLGLSICKTIISILKGEIGVESEEGKGSTFWFTIPCSLIKVS